MFDRIGRGLGVGFRDQPQLTLPVMFKGGITGQQTIYLYTQDRAGAYAGWDARGSWEVPSGNRAPSSISVTPSSGSGASQTFTFTVADPDGAEDLLGMMILVSPAAREWQGLPDVL